MKYTNLGNTGLRVSRLCLGVMMYGTKEWLSYAVPEDEARPFIKAALEGGINFFDTADLYHAGRNEELLGRALNDFTDHREDVVIATKLYFGTAERKENRWGLSRKHIMDAVDQSLRRLNTDYIDLYQIHRWDYATPIEETLEALTDIIRAGKVRYIGASATWAWQLERAINVAEKNGFAKFVSMQNRYNLVAREEEREMIPLCRDRNIAVIPFEPLAVGFLSGNRNKDGSVNTERAERWTAIRNLSPAEEENDFAILDRVLEVARRYGKSPTQISLAWLLAQKGVTAPIVGATKMNHVDQLLELPDIALEQADIDYLSEPYIPHRVTSHA